MAFPFLDTCKDLLIEALGDRLAPGVEDYLDLFCDDGVLEFPYAPAGGIGRVEGKPQIAAFVRSLEDTVSLENVRPRHVYPTSRRTVVVLEYVGTVHLKQDGARIRQEYIVIIQIRDGRVALLRKYLNPLSVMEATTRSDDTTPDDTKPDNWTSAGAAHNGVEARSDGA